MIDMEILTDAQLLFAKYKTEAESDGLQNPGRRASNKLKSHTELWSKVSDYIKFAKSNLLEECLIGGGICTECNTWWTAPVQRLVCENCFIRDPVSLKTLRKQRSVESRRKTNLEKYGHINAMWNTTIRQGIVDSWGVANPMQLKSVQDKSRATKAERYEGGHEMRDPDFRKNLIDSRGYLSPFELYETHEKSKSTWKANGYENPSNSPEIQSKKIETLLTRSGVSNPSKEDSYNEKVKSTHLRKSGGKYTHHMQDPTIHSSMLRKSLAVRKVAVNGEEFTVQGGAEERLIPYLLRAYGTVLTQFSDDYPIDKALSYCGYKPDFYLPRIDKFVECKGGAFYLIERRNEYERNKNKSIRSGSHLIWIVEVRKNSWAFLPEEWHNWPEEYLREYLNKNTKSI